MSLPRTPASPPAPVAPKVAAQPEVQGDMKLPPEELHNQGYAKMRMTRMSPDGMLYGDTAIIEMPREVEGPSTRSPELRYLQPIYQSSKCDVLVDTGNTNNQPDSTYEEVGQFFDDTTYEKDKNLFDPNNLFTHVNIKFQDETTNTQFKNYDAAGYHIDTDPTSVYINNDAFTWDLPMGSPISMVHETVAHEVQHNIEFKYRAHTTWINEGMSNLAMWYIHPDWAVGPSAYAYFYFLEPNTQLTTWGPLSADNSVHYGYSYTFIKYLFDHYGEYAVTRAIVVDRSDGTATINNVLSQLGFSDTFNDALKYTVTANMVQDSSIASGKYGYDRLLNDHLPLAVTEPVTINLVPDKLDSQEYGVVKHGGVFFDIKPYQDRSRLITLQKTSGNADFVLYKKGMGGYPSSVEDVIFDGNEAIFELDEFNVAYSAAYLIAVGYQSSTFDISMDSIIPMEKSQISISPMNPDGKMGWYISDVTVTLQSGDPSYSLFYRWDDDSFQPYGSPLSVDEGEHTLNYYSVEPGTGGRTETVRTKLFMLDLTPPVSSHSMEPKSPDGENGWYVSQPIFSIGTQNPHDIRYYKFGIEGSGTAQKYVDSLWIPEGNYTMTYWAEDFSGNTESESVIPVKYDNSTPFANLTIKGEPLENGWYTSAPTASVKLENKGPSPDMVYYRTVNTSEKSSSDAPYLAYDPSGDDLMIPDGEVTLQLYAMDEAGHQSDVLERDFKVDTAPPDITLSISPELPEEGSGWYQEIPSISFVCKEDATVFFQWTARDADPVEGSWDSSSPDSVIPVGEGENDLHAYAVAAGSGLSGSPIRFQVAPIDITVPETELDIGEADLSDWITDTYFLIRLTCSEEGSTIYYMWDDEYEEDAQEASSTIEPLLGEHTLHFWSVDRAGNAEDAQEIDIMFDPEEPKSMVSLSTNNPTVGQNVEFSAAASSDNLGLSEYRFETGDGTDSGWMASPTYTHAYSSSGEFTVVVSVKDLSGQIDKEEVEILVDDIPDDDGDDDGGDDGGDDSGSGSDDDDDGVDDSGDGSDDDDDPGTDDDDSSGTTDESDSSGGGDMGVVGLVIAIVAIVVVLLLLILLRKKKPQNSNPPQQPTEPPVYRGPPRYPSKDVPVYANGSNAQMGDREVYNGIPDRAVDVHQSQNRIIEVQNRLSEARARGLNVSRAEFLIENATAAHRNGQYNKALEFANQARSQL